VIVLDTTAPAAPSAPDLAAGSDSGVSNTDNITTVTTPLFTGTAEANSTVTLFDGATAVGSGKASPAGAWSITSKALSVGTHSIAAKATDVAGNISLVSKSLAVKIDASAPVTAINIGLAGTPSFISGGGSRPDILTATVSGQTLTGADPLIGHSRFDTQLSDTLSGLNSDAIQLLGGSDVVDLSALDFSKAKPLVYDGHASSGSFTTGNGTQTTNIEFADNDSRSSLYHGIDTQVAR
jgi:hypothetical protein